MPHLLRGQRIRQRLNWFRKAQAYWDQYGDLRIDTFHATNEATTFTDSRLAHLLRNMVRPDAHLCGPQRRQQKAHRTPVTRPFRGLFP